MEIRNKIVIITGASEGIGLATAEAFSSSRPGDRPNIEIDTPEQVAQKILELIESEAPEAEM